jgi:hypothetical protein
MKEIRKKYLILHVFQSNDFEGAYMSTKTRRVFIKPCDLGAELKKLPLTYEKDGFVWEVCSEIMVFDQGFKLVKEKKINTLKYRANSGRKA